jgi:ketopantoate reductase
MLRSRLDVLRRLNAVRGFGAGAIGSGIGGHLHPTGHAALLVGRPAHVDRIRQQGSSCQSSQRGLGSIEADFLKREIVHLGRLHGILRPYNEVVQEVSNGAVHKRGT